MDGMTDKQYDDAKATLLRLVLEILRHSKDLSEAIEKVEALLQPERHLPPPRYGIDIIAEAAENVKEVPEYVGA